MFEKNRKDYIVRKHNSLINSTSKKPYKTIELKFIAKIISEVHESDTDLTIKKLYLRDLEFVDNKTNNYTKYSKILSSLRKRDVILPDGTEVGWLSEFNIVDGYIIYEISKSLKKYILKLKSNNRQYYLSNIIRLSSRYSIHIYELLNQMRDRKGREMFLDDFKAILNIPNSYNITNIEKKVLNVAKKEIDEKTDLSFEYSFIKEGRKISKIKFSIKGSLYSQSQYKKGELL